MSSSSPSLPTSSSTIGGSGTVALLPASSNSPPSEIHEDRQRVNEIAQGAFSAILQYPCQALSSLWGMCTTITTLANGPWARIHMKGIGTLLGPLGGAPQPPYISSLPLDVIGIITSHLCQKDQSALAVAATHKQTENVRECIALARLSLLEALSSIPEIRDGFYSMTGQEFPSPDAIGAMRQLREESKHTVRFYDLAAKQIDQQIGKILFLLECCMQRGRNAIWDGFTAHTHFCGRHVDFTGKMHRHTPSTIQEFFSVFLAYNVVSIGEALGIVQFDAIHSIAGLLDAANSVSHKLAEDNPPIESLSVSDKHISFFPLEIAKFKDLAILKLDGNGIAILPREIGNLTELRKLNLSRNNLIALPEEFTKLINLLELDLAHNQFQECPHQVERLKNLTLLDLGDNPLTITPNDLAYFLNLKKLKDLYASTSQLKKWHSVGFGIILHRKNKDEPDLDVTLFL